MDEVWKFRRLRHVSVKKRMFQARHGTRVDKGRDGPGRVQRQEEITTIDD